MPTVLSRIRGLVRPSTSDQPLRLADGSGGGGGASLLTTKGDLLGYDTAPDRIPVGVDGTVLTSDSSAALGVSYKPGGALTVTDDQANTVSNVTNLEFAGATVSVPSGDPDWSNVSMLLHMNSLDGSDNAVDSGPHGLTFTGPGNAGCLQSLFSKFGGFAYDLSTPGGGVGGSAQGFRISIPVTTGGPLDLTGVDYTIEGWFYTYTAATSEGIFFSSIYPTPLFLEVQTGGTQLDGFIEGTAVPTVASTWTQNAWHHVALVVASGDFVVYIDGVAIAAPTTIASRASWVGTTFYIGGFNFGAGLVGLVDEVRVTKGVARYLSNFTPPAAAFPGLSVNSALVTVSSSTTVAGLSATAAQGQRNFVTDATSTTFLSIVAGGGSNKVPVVFDGTDWVIG